MSINDRASLTGFKIGKEIQRKIGQTSKSVTNFTIENLENQPASVTPRKLTTRSLSPIKELLNPFDPFGNTFSHPSGVYTLEEIFDFKGIKYS